MCEHTTAVIVLKRERRFSVSYIELHHVPNYKEKCLYLSASHIQGCLNVVAHRLSRPGPVSKEWKLDQAGQQAVRALILTPQIDLFATYENVS